MLLLVIGLAVVGAAVTAAWRRARRQARAAGEKLLRIGQDRQRLLDFMHLMAEALGEGGTIPDLRQRIVHASLLCTGALSGCFFERTEKETMRGVAVEGLFPPHRPLSDEVKARLITRAKFIEELLKSEEFPVGEGLVGRVAQLGRPELVADAAGDLTIVKHEDPALAVRSVIAVPLQFRETFFGVLAVANPADDRAFTDVEFSLLQTLAEQAALALHNAELLHLQIERKQLDLDLSIASGIQQMLLPRQTAMPAGLDVDARYAPAQRVGGDLYDVIPLSGNRLGVAVADVSGKGIPASLLMAITRTNLRQIANRLDSPAQVLNELNRVLTAEIRGDLYVTVIYAVVDPEKNQVSFARGGHELPLFGRREDPNGIFTAQFVGSEGMPVGMVPDALFSVALSERTEPFVPGDFLVLYTDGVTESMNEDRKEYSGARLADTARGLRGGSAREINDGVLASVRRFVGDTPPYDDLTLVTVKRL